jgi:hypothetical protein
MMAFFFTVCFPSNVRGLRCLKVVLVLRGELRELHAIRAPADGGEEDLAGDVDQRAALVRLVHLESSSILIHPASHSAEADRNLQRCR